MADSAPAPAAERQSVGAHHRSHASSHAARPAAARAHLPLRSFSSALGLNYYHSVATSKTLYVYYFSTSSDKSDL